MKHSETLTIIDGNFTYEDAKEILTEIFSSKINFHKIKNWSSQERFGKEDKIAQKRIPALINEMEKLQAILSEAKKYNKQLVISSEINIVLVDQ